MLFTTQTCFAPRMASCCPQGTRQSANTTPPPRRRQRGQHQPTKGSVWLVAIPPRQGKQPARPLLGSTPLPGKPTMHEVRRGRRRNFTHRRPGGIFLRGGRGHRRRRPRSRLGGPLRYDIPCGLLVVYFERSEPIKGKYQIGAIPPAS